MRVDPLYPGQLLLDDDGAAYGVQVRDFPENPTGWICKLFLVSWTENETVDEAGFTASLSDIEAESVSGFWRFRMTFSAENFGTWPEVGVYIARFRVDTGDGTFFLPVAVRHLLEILPSPTAAP
jgi:hypothetical protein